MFLRLITVIIFYCMLSACNTSPVMLEHLQAGKWYFSEGNFKCAFRQLLPVAVYGRVEAEYAVGYMYYYGYGIPQDPDSGLFWIQKAAARGYCPAIRALQLMGEGTPKCSLIEPYYDVSGACVCPKPYALPPRPCPCSSKSSFARQPSYPPSFPPPRQGELRSVTVSQNNSDSYALQLYGAYQLKHVKNLQKELSLAQGTRIWHTKHQNKNWYVLTYGSYSSIADARLARDDLPSHLNNFEPWVRNLNSLERA